ncbi:hypothetical protein K523DRAFT_316135 [Schizophyllum commune Tattone D]|nr:hypothetical protein K523DRAFT_316135 [Schizophyllum commune Tattone D]
MSGFVPFLLQMPEDAWEIPDRDWIRENYGSRLLVEYTRSFRFTRPLTASDWEPVYKCSNRVKHLLLCDTPSKIAEALHTCPPSRTLFPNLRQCNLLDAELSAELLDHLLPPSVAFLEINGTPGFCPVFPLTIRFPHLVSLRVTCPDHKMGHDGVIYSVETLRVAQQLETLAICVGDGPAVMAAASSSPSIITLHAMGITDRSIPPGLSSDSFSSLKAIHMSGPHSIQFAIQLLESCPIRPLESLSIQSSPREAPQLPHLLQVVAQHCEVRTLRDLSVDVERDPQTLGQSYPVEVYNDTLRLEQLEPLSSFHLQGVRIGTTRGPSLTDADYATVASWWPNLNALRLSCSCHYRTDDDVPAATLNALTVIVSGCPDLEYLDIPIDARIVPSVPSVQHGSLWRLGVNDAPITDPEAVAAFLSSLLPELYCLEYDDGYREPDSDSEDDVPPPDPNAPDAKRRRLWAIVRETMGVGEDPF